MKPCTILEAMPVPTQGSSISFTPCKSWNLIPMAAELSAEARDDKLPFTNNGQHYAPYTNSYHLQEAEKFIPSFQKIMLNENITRKLLSFKEGRFD